MQVDLRKSVEVFDQRIARMREEHEATEKRLAEAVEKTDAHRPFAQGFLATFIPGLLRTRVMLIEFQKIDRLIMPDFEALFDFLLKREGQYSFRENKAVFPTEEEAAQFTGLLTSIRSRAAEQQALKKKYVEEATKKLADLEQLREQLRRAQ